MKMSAQHKNTVQGFSLVELLISVVISLIVISSIVKLVFNSKKTFIDSQEVSYIQDNVRFVMDFLARDIRMAGFKECGSDGAVITSIVEKNTLPALLGLDGDEGFLHIKGYSEVKAEFIGQKAGTDSLMLRRGGVWPNVLVQSHSPDTQTFQVVNTTGFNPSTPMMIVDAKCQNVGVFMVNTVSANSVTYGGELNCADASLKSLKNCGPAAAGSQAFASGSRLIPYVAAGYYIGESSVIYGKNALKRISLKNDLTPVIDEVALGVETMSIRYGVANGNAIKFLGASEITDADWRNNIVSVELTLIFQAQGALKNSDGSLLTKSLTSTIQIRNRI